MLTFAAKFTLMREVLDNERPEIDPSDMEQKRNAWREMLGATGLYLAGSLVFMPLLLWPMLPQLGFGDQEAFSAIIKGIGDGKNKEVIPAVRIVLMIMQFCMFIIPALLFAAIYKKNDAFGFLGLNRLADAKVLVAVIALMFLVTPVVQFLLEQMTLFFPEGADSPVKLQEALMQMPSSTDLFMNVILVGLLAATGEELFFRGVLLPTIKNLYGKTHVAIWITALIFSWTHNYTAGFLPILLLGALLGYLYVWTGSLWVPIIGHFVHNSWQVVYEYMAQHGQLSNALASQTSFSWPWVLGSALICAGLIYFLKIKSSELIVGS